jgi:hypothetical protein
VSALSKIGHLVAATALQARADRRLGPGCPTGRSTNRVHAERSNKFVNVFAGFHCVSSAVVARRWQSGSRNIVRRPCRRPPSRPFPPPRRRLRRPTNAIRAAPMPARSTPCGDRIRRARDTGDQVIPGAVASRRHGPRPGEPLHEQAQIINLVEVGPAPAMRWPRTARATRLIEEQAAFAAAHAEIVGLAHARESSKRKREQTPLGDRVADQLLDRGRGRGKGR